MSAPHPLHLACLKNQFTKVKNLLQSSFGGVEERTHEGFTPLMLCCKLNNPRLAKLLIDHKASLNAVDKVGATALMISSEQGNLQVVVLLVKAGADLYVEDVLGKSALYLAAEQERLEIVKILLKAGANPCSRKNDGMTTLHTAARHGRLEVMKALVTGGASLSDSVLNKDGLCAHDAYVPLDMACIGGYTEVVRWVLSFGLEICGGHTGGQQAFQVASFFGRVDILELLSQEGIRDAGAALIFGVFGSRQESVKFLLRHLSESSINYRDARGRTALMMAVGKYNFSSKMAKWLIQVGADTTVRVEVKKHGRILLNDTLLDWTARLMVGETEENVEKVKAVRRVLMQEDAILANSWAWPDMWPDTCTNSPKKERGGVTNLLRKHSQATSRVVKLALSRYSAKT